MSDLTPEKVLEGYIVGFFPMGQDDGGVYWYAPDPRGIIPLDEFHIPSTLAQQVRQKPFKIYSDRAFDEVIENCADREETWITEPVMKAYKKLHELGFAHSVECWENGELVGGLYGVALGSAFFGESMFYRKRNASKIALVHLVRNLRKHRFRLLDIQFSTDHLCQFGARDIPRHAFERRLDEAMHFHATWHTIAE